ncbi:MAG: IS1380 family transposase [Alphaproteobacteria bacterium]
MADDRLLPLDLPAVARKKVTLAFDGGRLSSDGGVLLLRAVERGLGIAERLAGCLTDRRDPARIDHTVVEMLRTRMFAIAAGYEDADDCDVLRDDPIFKMAVGRAPETGGALCSQPTMSRLENAPSEIEIARMMAAMVDLFCDSFARVPGRIVLDIDDTEDKVHGAQQLALFNAHYDGYCFLPIHVFEAASGKPVAAVLRPGKTPSGAEARTIVKHLIGRIRRTWPRVAILLRGDGHYARPEVMEWCEANDLDYIFGLGGNQVLYRRVAALVEDVAVRRAGKSADVKLRRFADLRYAAAGWRVERRVIARIEASTQGTDRRFVVTNLGGRAKHLYERVYCARGQAENLIKAHKLHLASDRTSCMSATANQFRLLLHTGAYWLLHRLRRAAPKRSFWRTAQLDTIRLRLIKLAARVVETRTRIKVSLPTACPDKSVLALIAARLAARPP